MAKTHSKTKTYLVGVTYCLPKGPGHHSPVTAAAVVLQDLLAWAAVLASLLSMVPVVMQLGNAINTCTNMSIIHMYEHEIFHVIWLNK